MTDRQDIKRREKIRADKEAEAFRRRELKIIERQEKLTSIPIEEILSMRALVRSRIQMMHWKWHPRRAH